MTVKIIKRKNEEVFRPLTLRQQKVVSLVSGNIGKSKASILRKAGYSPSVVDNPDHVFNSLPLKSALETTITKMRVISDKALTALENKPFNKESAYNLAMISSTMTKNLELLEGRPIDRGAYELPVEEKSRLLALLEKNKARGKCAECSHK